MLVRTALGVAVVVVVACRVDNVRGPTPSGTTTAPDVTSKAATKPPISPEVARWTAMLGDPSEGERAVTELEQLGDPSAIEALAEAWSEQGRSPRILRVIIGLARPLTADEAKATVRYERSSRPASWDRARPVLVRAVTELDAADPRSVDSAQIAAEALGEARLAAGLPALFELVSRPADKKTIAAQIAAIRALGTFSNEQARVGTQLKTLIGLDPPPHPRVGTDAATTRALEAPYALFLAKTGAAINAIAALRDPTATSVLLIAMYRVPELFTQLRRALVASPAADDLRKVLRREHAEVNAVFAREHLDRYCGRTKQCTPVSAMDFYAAQVLGDFYDPAAVPDLLTALQRQPAPAYFSDDQPSPSTQYNAIVDALRKIGSPAAAVALRTIWQSGNADVDTRVLAIGAYPFVTRDDVGIDQLGMIAADNAADEGLRLEAATAFARLAHDATSIGSLNQLARRYLDASAKKRVEANGKPRVAFDAANKAFELALRPVEAARAALAAIAGSDKSTADEIQAATANARQAETVFAAAKKLHRERIAPYRQLDSAAAAYLGFARMFQTHIARVEVAMRCRADVACYAASLDATVDQVVGRMKRYLADLPKWTVDEKRALITAGIERSMLELGKRGAAAHALTETLLDHAGSEDRVIRQSILLALPKIAKLPCPSCVTKLDAAIKAGEGKSSIGDLVFETTMVRNYFARTK